MSCWRVKFQGWMLSDLEKWFAIQNAQLGIDFKLGSCKSWELNLSCESCCWCMQISLWPLPPTHLQMFSFWALYSCLLSWNFWTDCPYVHSCNIKKSFIFATFSENLQRNTFLKKCSKCIHIPKNKLLHLVTYVGPHVVFFTVTVVSLPV